MANLNVRRKQVHQFKEPSRVDPLRARSRPVGQPQCRTCGAVSVRGRWLPGGPARRKSTAPAPNPEKSPQCPACQQLKQRFALGVIELQGSKWKEKSDLVNNTIRRTEQIARLRNDQQRILWTKSVGDTTKIYVTLPELARRIGRELEKSFQGVTEYESTADEAFLRVRWSSDLPHPAHQLGAPLKAARRSVATPGRRKAEPAHRSKAFRGRGRAA